MSKILKNSYHNKYPELKRNITNLEKQGDVLFPIQKQKFHHSKKESLKKFKQQNSISYMKTNQSFFPQRSQYRYNQHMVDPRSISPHSINSFGEVPDDLN
tara:strand:- start:677 stop:976 length:300 start_codon:yes stop_codon:yes gene_type:complete